jgi:hypothetical protein
MRFCRYIEWWGMLPDRFHRTGHCSRSETIVQQPVKSSCTGGNARFLPSHGLVFSGRWTLVADGKPISASCEERRRRKNAADGPHFPPPSPSGLTFGRNGL